MSRSKLTEAEMIAAVKQMEAGRRAEDVAREVGVSTHTVYSWKSKYGGMDVSEAQEAKRLRSRTCGRSNHFTSKEWDAASGLDYFGPIYKPLDDGTGDGRL